MSDSSQNEQTEPLTPLQWIHESVAHWDADKARIVGGAPAGSLPISVSDHAEGDVLPDDWWRVEHEGRCVGYGRMDVTWGDAEILLVVEPEAQHRGVGSFILEKLEQEARNRGLNYLYNQVQPEHPAEAEITSWLRNRAFTQTEDGKLARAVVASARTGTD
jgi:N-acetylglutamate synthase-like GNAT family acetyltransferase